MPSKRKAASPKDSTATIGFEAKRWLAVGSIGEVAYLPEASRYERYIVSQRQFHLRCNRALLSPFYITSYFKTPGGQHRLLANTSSTGVPSISQPVTYLRQLKMIVPPPCATSFCRNC